MAAEQKILPRLYMVTDGRGLHGGPSSLPDLVRRVASRLPVIVQLREKQLTGLELLALALALRNEIRLGTSSLLCVNERTDIALLCGADGVHFPETSCPVNMAMAPARGLISGKSSHSLQSALEAESEGVDYLFFGPVFETPSKKPFGPPKGLEELGRVCVNVSVPVFAIGGMSPERARRCLDEGAYGVAAISAFSSKGVLEETLDAFESVLAQ
ncbi:hypothetical protein CHL67_06350 [Prosthecochloris sp. GSB1]|uniref:thiamine phosphate synthase n=1 Tax=Prosthecochloris sp. GSB1 TaxID=281093 RepID=UPI000B8D1A99|nr:thiamine phosphate synthase [Prosthecochloris sp. GSB1]ASQ90593.1 hypothetical protein CHL67_06350 [Prosthecochloris sp. GSB1]